MSDGSIVETVYGKYHKYEVVKRIGPFGGVKFYVHRDGNPHRGPYSTLKEAVAAAQADAR